ncbi:MAG: DUF4178 domain-containing protein [Myxococcota bacterium]
MSETIQCGRCNTQLPVMLPPPCTSICPQCRMAHVIKPGESPRMTEEMPAVPPAGGPLKVGVEGEWEGAPFRITGRTRLSQGTARWNEWALRTRNGEVHFLSDAQGALHALKLRGPRANAPSPASLVVGARVELEPGEVFHVKERGESVVVGAEGELPFELQLGTRTAFADLSSVGGALGTLDWREGMDAPPDLWDGYPVVPGDLGLKAARGGANTISCISCHNTVTVHLGEATETVGCPKCRTVQVRDGDAWRGAAPAITDALDRIIPLGATGGLRGEALRCVGVTGRSCVVDGETYRWEEYFLVVEDARGGPVEARYRWLAHQDGHWTFLRPVSIGDVVSDGVGGQMYQGDVFREFSTVRATVDEVLGEQPFLVQPGDQAIMSDYVAPPRMLSLEATGNEEFWTLGDYVSPDELRDAFNLREVPTPHGVAPCQPNSARQSAWWMLILTLLFSLVIMLIYASVSRGAKDQTLLDVAVSPTVLAAPGPDGTPPADPAFYSDPILVPLDRKNVQVNVQGEVDNAWMTFDVALIHEASGEVRGTALDVGYWHGVEGGYSWSEGSRVDTSYLSDVRQGTNVLRVDVECERKPCPPYRLQLTSHVPRPLYAFLLILLLACFPLIAFAYAQYFETQRWMNSTHSAG